MGINVYGINKGIALIRLMHQIVIRLSLDFVLTTEVEEETDFYNKS